MKPIDYELWIESIFAKLQESIGGDLTQTGSSRKFGVGLFSFAMSQKPQGDMGEVVFQVGRVDDLLRRQLAVGPYEWYAHPDVDIVVKALLEAYQTLGP